MSNESNEICDWLAKCWKPVAEPRLGVTAKSDPPVGDRSIPGDVRMIGRSVESQEYWRSDLVDSGLETAKSSMKVVVMLL